VTCLTYLDGNEDSDNAEHHILSEDSRDVCVLIVVDIEERVHEDDWRL